MSTPSENLARSLEALRALQEQGVIAIRSRHLSRTDRERLLRGGFLREVMKGWYVPGRPDEPAGESTGWYTSFWAFCRDYLNERFGADWCLSPEHSLAIHAGDWNVPRQVLVRSPSGGNRPVRLPFNTSILDIKAALPEAQDMQQVEELRVYALVPALIHSSPTQFASQPVVMRAALAQLRDTSELLRRLLDGGHSRIAGRLAGALRNIGRLQAAEDILATMRAAGYVVQESDPFNGPSPVALTGAAAPVERLRMRWALMREDVLEHFGPPRQRLRKAAYLSQMDDAYVADAYNSLSIEGYRVSAELIERVRSGNWNPDGIEADRDHRDALAARGYWQAFQQVRRSVGSVLDGDDPGRVAARDHGAWYRELFAPGVTAGLVRPSELAGYRNGPVYIRRSMHLPPRAETLSDLMPAFFDLLANEPAPEVRVVLGHFVFVYIHPYFDGNGRIGRFMMNVMMAAGGYSRTIVPLQARDEYMGALEAASADGNIVPFAQFLNALVNENIRP